MTPDVVQNPHLVWPRRLLRILVLMLAAHATLFALFDVMPSAEMKLGGWMVADPLALQRFRASLGGSDTTMLDRYLTSLNHLIHGSLGMSLSGYSVGSILKARFLVSLPVLALVTVGICGVVLSATLWSCARTPPKGWVMWQWIIKAGLMPTLITSALLKALVLEFGFNDVFRMHSMAQLTCLATLTGILPASLILSITCAEAAEVAAKPFATTLVSQGRSDLSIRIRLLSNVWRALRPALGRAMMHLAGGLVFAEVVWDVPGFGRILAEALQSADYALLQGWMLVVGLIALTNSIWEARRP